MVIPKVALIFTLTKTHLHSWLWKTTIIPALKLYTHSLTNTQTHAHTYDPILIPSDFQTETEKERKKHQTSKKRKKEVKRSLDF